jgi:hypothetical protein
VVAFVIAMPAWGERHVGLMLDVALPSLLAPGNLPMFDSKGVELRVYTSARDIHRIGSSGVLERIRASGVRTTGEVMPSVVLDSDDRHAPASWAFAHALRYAFEIEAAMLPLPPDAVYADGFLSILRNAVEHGTRVVHVAGLRTRMDAMMADAVECRDGVIQLSPRELAGHALSNLHPCMVSHLWGLGDDQDRSHLLPPLQPSQLLWAVGGGGLLIRSFHPHPALIRPSVMPSAFDGTVDMDFALKTVHDLGGHVVLMDSDVGCLYSLYPEGFDVGGTHQRTPESVASWAHPPNVNALHLWAVRHEIRVHHGDLERSVPAAEWRAVSDRAKSVIDTVLEGASP